MYFFESLLAAVTIFAFGYTWGRTFAMRQRNGFTFRVGSKR